MLFGIDIKAPDRIRKVSQRKFSVTPPRNENGLEFRAAIGPIAASVAIAFCETSAFALWAIWRRTVFSGSALVPVPDSTSSAVACTLGLECRNITLITRQSSAEMAKGPVERELMTGRLEWLARHSMVLRKRDTSWVTRQTAMGQIDVTPWSAAATNFLTRGTAGEAVRPGSASVLEILLDRIVGCGLQRIGRRFAIQAECSEPFCRQCP